jgi:hypothetical protein
MVCEREGIHPPGVMSPAAGGGQADGGARTIGQ